MTLVEIDGQFTNLANEPFSLRMRTLFGLTSDKLHRQAESLGPDFSRTPSTGNSLARNIKELYRLRKMSGNSRLVQKSRSSQIELKSGCSAAADGTGLS